VEKFVARYRSLVTGVLSGFDRLVFRGHLLPLVRPQGMYFFLEDAGVRLLDFKEYVVRTTERIKSASLAEAQKLGRPVCYLDSPTINKEEFVRRLVRKHPVEQGLICVLKALEPCVTFEYHRSQDHKERGLKLRPSKCLHLYKYFLHPRFGLLNARLQTWFPFNIQICMNGRAWLARQLQRRGRSDFKRADNCFTWLADPALAQRLMNGQLTTNWPRALDAIARSLNPLHHEIFRPRPMDYYWSAYQTEWATDVMFKDPRSLAEVYPRLVHHAMHHFQSPDVMRFLGRKAHGNFIGELVTSFKDRPEGVRIKHWVRGNSVKMYDKAGSILRVETTVAQTADFKVFRPRQDRPDGKLALAAAAQGCRRPPPPRPGLPTRRTAPTSRPSPPWTTTLRCPNSSTASPEPATYHGRRVRALRVGDPADLAAVPGHLPRRVHHRRLPQPRTPLPPSIPPRVTHRPPRPAAVRPGSAGNSAFSALTA